MINNIQDIKNKHKERMKNAVLFSDRISTYIRYLAITGLGLIWLLVEKVSISWMSCCIIIMHKS